MLPLICVMLTLKSSHSLFNKVSQDSNMIVAKPWFLNWGGVSINSILTVCSLQIILEINKSFFSGYKLFFKQILKAMFGQRISILSETINIRLSANKILALYINKESTSVLYSIVSSISLHFFFFIGKN